VRTVLTAAMLAMAAAPALADDPVEAGKALAELNCARCHAIGADGESPHADAPPFRSLGERYPLDALEEAFASGHITSAHPDMPDFTATPEQAGALIAYIDSVQDAR
jgi:Cytochrome c553